MGNGGAGIGEREVGYGGIGMGVGIVRKRVAEIDEGMGECDALSLANLCRRPISGLGATKACVSLLCD